MGVEIDLTMNTTCRRYSTKDDSRLVDRCPIPGDEEDQVRGKGRSRYWMYIYVEGKGMCKRGKKGNISVRKRISKPRKGHVSTW